MHIRMKLLSIICFLLLIGLCGCESNAKNISEQKTWDDAPVISVPEQSDAEPEHETIPALEMKKENDDIDKEIERISSEVTTVNSEDGTQSGDDDSAGDTENSEIEVTQETRVEESENTDKGVSEIQQDWVSSLNISKQTAQLLIVSANGSSATVSFHTKTEDGLWAEQFSTQGKIGKNGIGKTKEGDKKTPKGIYHFLFAFGAMPDPGAKIQYRKINGGDYWVDDSSSQYYNQFVNTNDVTKDWSSAEHLEGAGASYNYALATDYNVSCERGKGSAIFVHCLPTGGAGCIAIPQEYMKLLVSKVQSDCVIIIDSQAAIEAY